MVKRVGERAQRKDKKKQLRPWLPGTHSAEIRSLTKFRYSSCMYFVYYYLRKYREIAPFQEAISFLI